MSPVVLAMALVVLAPLVADEAIRRAGRYTAIRPSRVRLGFLAAVVAGLLLGAVWLTGPRPATAAYAWGAGAAVVLAVVDLAVHRLPDRVTYPAAVVALAAFTADAALLGTWPALLRSLAAATAAFGLAALARLLSPEGLGFGDVKLLGLLGLLLGWVSWGALLAGVFLGLLTGAAVSLILLATGRAGWRTAVPFGPPLLVGAVLALALQGPVSLG